MTHPHRQTRLWSTIAIASATLKVKDLAKTTAFYKDTFGINVAESNGKTVLFLHDKSSMELLPADSEASLEMGEVRVEESSIVLKNREHFIQ